MKHYFLALAYCLLSQSSFSQGISIDSTFSGDGVLESGISPNSQYQGSVIKPQPDGKILACGHPISSPATNLSIVRYLSDGQIDSSFLFTGQLSFQGYKCVIGLQEDGKILCGFRTGLIRRLANGMIDTTFGTNGFVPHNPNYNVTAVIILPNGKIAVVGDRNDDPTLGYVVRVYHPNGTLDTSFSNDGILTYKHGAGISYILNAQAQTDGKILLTGDYYATNGEIKFTVLRLTSEGAFDPTFGVNGFVDHVLGDHNQVFGLAIQEDGKIVVTGYVGFPKKLIVLRYLSTGTRDFSFGVDGLQNQVIDEEAEGRDVLIREDGKILVLGRMKNTSTNSNLIFLAQLLADGTLDTSFGNNGIFINPVPTALFGPCSMFLTEGNKLVVGRNSSISSKPLIITRFILDLNVGILNPGSDIQQNLLIYPNPITDHFSLNFALQAPERVSIDLFDMSGKFMKRLAQDQFFDVGEHKESFNTGQELPSGNYVLAISIQGKIVSSIQILKN
ncbi:MAG: T9SS type A sorting domain-containing protein [Saprospiraceae bacterium]